MIPLGHCAPTRVSAGCRTKSGLGPGAPFGSDVDVVRVFPATTDERTNLQKVHGASYVPVCIVRTSYVLASHNTESRNQLLLDALQPLKRPDKTIERTSNASLSCFVISGLCTKVDRAQRLVATVHTEAF